MRYDPRNWYWLADDGRLFSSAVQALIPATDPGYEAWVAGSGVATRWPVDDRGAQTTASLQDVLTPYGLFTDLIGYANERQWAIATGGYSATIGGKAYLFDTSPTGQSLLIGKVVRLSQANAPATVQWQFGPQNFATFTAADFLAAATAAADFVQKTFDAVKGIEAAIAANPPTITTRAQVDAVLAAIG